MKNPDKEQIKQWLKDETTRWFLERIAYYLNGIDTVRDITPENVNTALARRLAIEIIESAFGDIYQQGELQNLQKKISLEEENIIKRLQEVRHDY